MCDRESNSFKRAGGEVVLVEVVEHGLIGCIEPVAVGANASAPEGATAVGTGIELRRGVEDFAKRLLGHVR